MKGESVRERFLAELKRIGMILCCCIKDRCVAFIEERSRPPPKKDAIVKEIIAELGKLEGGIRVGGAMLTGTENVDVSSRIESSQSEQNEITEQQSSSGAAAAAARPVMSLIEERQRSIARQLDSIPKERPDHPMSQSTSIKPDMNRTKQGKEAERKSPSDAIHQGKIKELDQSPLGIKSDRDDLVNPYWVLDRSIGAGPVRYMDQNETQFWQKLIEKYLYPIDQGQGARGKD